MFLAIIKLEWLQKLILIKLSKKLGGKMKVLKELDEAKLVIVDLEVNLGKEVRSAPTLCAKYKGKIIPLNTAHDGRPILMREENSINNN